MAFNHIAVVGGGAWGTALALTCVRAGRKVTLWEADAAHAAHLQRTRTSKFLPGVTLDDAIVLAGEAAAAAEASAVLLVVPAQAVRAVSQSLAPLIAAKTPVIVCAKGIERGSRKFMTEIVAECMPGAVPAILSGPSFAADVARGLPTAVTLAAGDEKLASELAQAIGSATLSAVPLGRRSRRRDRRCGQECARHRRGHSCRARHGRECCGGVDHARLRRAHALRQSLRRAAGNIDGLVRPRRFDLDLFQPAVAQFHLRRQSRPR